MEAGISLVPDKAGTYLPLSISILGTGRLASGTDEARGALTPSRLKWYNGCYEY